MYKIWFLNAVINVFSKISLSMLGLFQIKGFCTSFLFLDNYFNLAHCYIWSQFFVNTIYMIHIFHSDNLCLLISMFRLFTFSVIIDMCRFRSTILFLLFFHFGGGKCYLTFSCILTYLLWFLPYLYFFSLNCSRDYTYLNFHCQISIIIFQHFNFNVEILPPYGAIHFILVSYISSYTLKTPEEIIFFL